MVARTNSRIACFAAPSFHDGSRPSDVAVCAYAGRGGGEGAENGKGDSSTPRSMPGGRTIWLVFHRGLPLAHFLCWFLLIPARAAPCAPARSVFTRIP